MIDLEKTSVGLRDSGIHDHWNKKINELVAGKERLQARVELLEKVAEAATKLMDASLPVQETMDSVDELEEALAALQEQQ